MPVDSFNVAMTVGTKAWGRYFSAGIRRPSSTTIDMTVVGSADAPSLTVANADGIVMGRLDFTWDRAELRAALQRV